MLRSQVPGPRPALSLGPLPCQLCQAYPHCVSPPSDPGEASGKLSPGPLVDGVEGPEFGSPIASSGLSRPMAAPPHPRKP